MRTGVSIPSSSARWSSDQWQAFLGTIFRPEHLSFLPAKMFRLNAQAHYVDCFFPIPCEHYFGGENILGHAVREILPKATWQDIRHGLKHADTHHTPVHVFTSIKTAQYPLSNISVLLLPLQTKDTLAFVTDFNPDGSPRFPMDEWNPSVRQLKAKLWPQEDGPPHEPTATWVRPQS